MNDVRIPIGDWAEVVVDFVVANFAGFFLVLRTIFLGMYDAVDWALSSPPFWVVIVLIAALGVLARGWLFGAVSAAALLLIVAMNQWDNAMDTLALVLVAAFVAIAVSIPIGIAAARSQTLSTIVRPVLDFLQTMPAFVYLIPALLLFRVGVAPGIVATIIFASRSSASGASTRRSSRPGRRSARRQGASCGRSSCRLRCRRSWPA